MYLALSCVMVESDNPILVFLAESNACFPVGALPVVPPIHQVPLFYLVEPKGIRMQHRSLALVRKRNYQEFLTTGVLGIWDVPSEQCWKLFCLEKQIVYQHSVIFLGEMQTKFYCQNVGTIVIFDKKMFKFLCHIIGSNHYRD